MEKFFVSLVLIYVRQPMLSHINFILLSSLLKKLNPYFFPFFSILYISHSFICSLISSRIMQNNINGFMFWTWNITFRIEIDMGAREKMIGFVKNVYRRQWTCFISCHIFFAATHSKSAIDLGSKAGNLHTNLFKFLRISHNISTPRVNIFLDLDHFRQIRGK